MRPSSTTSSIPRPNPGELAEERETAVARSNPTNRSMNEHCLFRVPLTPGHGHGHEHAFTHTTINQPEQKRAHRNASPSSPADAHAAK